MFFDVVSVLHLITDLDRGGTETALLRLVSRLDSRRFRSVVVSLISRGALEDHFLETGVEVITLGSTPWARFRGLWKLTRLIRTFQPDVLQTWLYQADLVGLLAGRAFGARAITWNIRCGELARDDHSRFLFWVLAVLARLSAVPDAVVVNSFEGRRVHEALGYRPRRWEMIPNGFDTEAFAPSLERRRQTRLELGVADDALLVGVVARYHPMKDHRTFLKACRQVAANCPRARFVMAGRSVDERNEELTRLVGEYGLQERVHLLGETGSPAALFTALDVAVSSSYSEAFPNVVAEAMATGVPVVATDAGDSARIVGDAGVIVPCRDGGALAAAISRMLSLSGEERQALGSRGRDRIIAEFSLESMVKHYELLYRELADKLEPEAASA